MYKCIFIRFWSKRRESNPPSKLGKGSNIHLYLYVLSNNYNFK